MYWIGGQIACAITNAMRSRRKPYPIEDFIPREKAKREMSPDQMLKVMQMVAAGQNAMVKARGAKSSPR